MQICWVSGSLGHRVPRSFWILGGWAFSNHKLVGLFSKDRLSSWCKWCLNSIGIPQFPWTISESIHGNFEMGTFGFMGKLFLGLPWSHRVICLLAFFWVWALISLNSLAWLVNPPTRILVYSWPYIWSFWNYCCWYLGPLVIIIHQPTKMCGIWLRQPLSHIGPSFTFFFIFSSSNFFMIGKCITCMILMFLVPLKWYISLNYLQVNGIRVFSSWNFVCFLCNIWHITTLNKFFCCTC